MTKIRPHLPIILLLTATLAVRLIGLGERPYFNDELSALFRTQEESFSSLVENGILPDYHPAGVQTFLWIWVKWVGMEPFMVRLPFALAGTLSILLLFLLGKRWFGNTTAWLAAASFAFLQFPVFYSQLARPYSTGVLMILAAVWFADHIPEAKNEKPIKRYLWATGMAIALASALYNHYFSALTAGFAGIMLLGLFRKKTLLPYLSGCLAAGILFLPHWPVTLEQVDRGGLASWLPPPNPDALFHHLLYIFNDSIWITGILLLICIPALGHFFICRYEKRTGNRFFFSLFLYLGLLLFAYIYSVRVNPILQNSIMLFAFPFLLLALFAGFGNQKTLLTQIISWGWPVLLILHLIFGVHYYQKEHYVDFRRAAEKICQVLKQNKHTAWGVQVNHPWYIHYYLDKTCSADSALFYLVESRQDLSHLNQMLDTLQAEQFVYTWLRPADPMIVSVIRYHFPYLTDYQNFDNQNELFVFSRSGSVTCPVQYEKDTNWLVPVDLYNQSTVMMPEDEFFSLYSGQISSVKPGQDALIHVTLDGDYEPQAGELQLVITTENSRGEPISWNSLPLSVFGRKSGPFFFTSLLPGSDQTEQWLKVFIWNPGKDRMNLRNCSVMFIR